MPCGRRRGFCIVDEDTIEVKGKENRERERIKRKMDKRVGKSDLKNRRRANDERRNVIRRKGDRSFSASASVLANDSGQAGCSRPTPRGVKGL